MVVGSNASSLWGAPRATHDLDLVIDPEECIDCTLCEPECPAEAIFAEDDVPQEQQLFIALNAELCAGWPVITVQKPAPPDAAEWDGKPDKLKLSER